MSPRGWCVPALVLALVLVVPRARAADTLSTAPPPVPAPAPGDSVAPMATTPAPQPPLALLDPRSLPVFRTLFNQDAHRTRLLLLVSASCPFCLHGLADMMRALSHDYSDLALYVVWEHITSHDRAMPGPDALLRVSDPRARQFWDPHRTLSDVVVHDLPADSLDSVSEADAAGERVAWDCALLFRPGVRWEEHLPAPDWSGRPIVERMDAFTHRLRAIQLTRHVH